ncbi:putative transposase [Paraburkholderia atlantica]|uniref:Transposase InsO family protein n=1 Tax=Paraburkholderia atlantica TaxID=2654982 RepID=A0A7W8Q1H9_PARAM|nr:transposase InsO family protein [Paraburkholderia atlantica]MBB5429503.1 transposase InsO family protein [Paraburkholderia atlantica]
MGELQLKSLVRPKRYRSWRGEVGRVAPTLLNREFEARRPDQKWVTDVTEFNVNGEKLYLSPVMDLYNGEIVAWQTARRPCFELVSNMLKKAVPQLGTRDKPLLHSDRAGSTRCLPGGECLARIGYGKACRAEETAWIMPQWKASLAR